MKKTSYAIVSIIILIAIVSIIKKVDDTNVRKNEIRIGVISTLTGNAAYYGQSTMHGAEVARAEMQAKYPNKKIVLYHEDSLFTPKGGIDAYNKVKDADKVQAIMVQGSNVAVAVEAIANKDNMLQVDASVLASSYRTPDDMSFRMTPGGGNEISFAVDYLVRNNLKRVAVLYLKNEIGQTLSGALASSTGIQILANEGYAPDTTDFKTLLTKINQTHPDVIYIAGIAAQTATVLKQSDELGIKSKFMSYRGTEDPVLLKNAGRLAEGILYTSAYENAFNADYRKPKDVSIDTFMKEYLGMYHDGGLPNAYAAEAYEGTKIIIEALLKCGDNKMCQKDYVSSIKDRATVFGNISFDSYGDVSYPFFMKTVYEGGFSAVERN